MPRLLSRIGLAAAGHWKRTIALVVVLIVAVGAASGAAGGKFVDEFTAPGVDSQAASDLLEERFPAAAGDDATLVFAVDGGGLTGARKAAAEQTLHTVARQPDVLKVSDLTTSRDGRIASATVQYDAKAEDVDEDARKRLEDATRVAEQAGVEVSMRGAIVDWQEEQAAPVGELLGVALALIILTLLFRSVVAMAVTLGAALFGLAGGMALLALASAGIEIPTVAPTIGVMLGLGAGIDYALMLVARQRELLRAGDGVLDGVRHANGTSGVAVLTAGAIVVVAISGLLAVGVPFVGRMGLGAAIVVAVCAVAAITVVPALLGAVGRRVLPKRERPLDAEPPAEQTGRFVARVASLVGDRPLPSALAATAVLLALAAPVLGLRLGQPDDGTRPADTTQRVAYDRLAEGFGAGHNGPLLLAVALPDDATGKQRALDDLVAGARAHPDVAAVAEPTVNDSGDAATIVVVPRTAPQDERTSALVDTLREEIVPTAVHGTGAEAHVGGVTASFDDVASKITERLPVFIAIVVGLSLLLLTAVFRSVVLPLVSAVFNLLSIGAAYGVVTLAFQTETGTSLLGVAEQPIVSFVPLIMFAILFGLSMDYNVFLLSRVREEWLRTGDARAAVRTALTRTAAVIGAAGAIMTAVFLAFMLEDDATVKMFGLGLATAIAIDVTIVRLVLAPAVLTLLGERAWYMPRWLERAVPRLDLEGAREPEPERQLA